MVLWLPAFIHHHDIASAYLAMVGKRACDDQEYLLYSPDGKVYIFDLAINYLGGLFLKNLA